MRKWHRHLPRHGGARLTELAQLRDRLRCLRDQVAEEKRELLADRTGLVLSEADIELARRQNEAGRRIH
ncbi:MAG: hypothetical protein WC048_16885 [Rhizobium sp.]